MDWNRVVTTVKRRQVDIVGGGLGGLLVGIELARAGAQVTVLEAGGVIYVCGDGSRMEPDVRRTLADLAREHGHDGAAWMDGMIADQRYVLDVWAGA